uniref:ZN692 protein n=1 Tax=Malurus cyaneus samueli TaxID=2593467 RepID=A0A8C5X1V9_9PASS
YGGSPAVNGGKKRRELDARHSKCRIRIGGHLERWCRLKEQLGFTLHSQLAQFLLDRSLWGAQKPLKPTWHRENPGFCLLTSVFPCRYSSHGCTWSPGRHFSANYKLASSNLGP